MNKLKRIVRVKEHLRQAAEWRLGELVRQEREALQEEESLIAALNAEHPLHGHLVEAMATHLRKVAERLRSIRAAKLAEIEKLREDTGQLKHAERVLTDVDRSHRRMTERKELADSVEAVLARDHASLP